MLTVSEEARLIDKLPFDKTDFYDDTKTPRCYDYAAICTDIASRLVDADSVKYEPQIRSIANMLDEMLYSYDSYEYTDNADTSEGYEHMRDANTTIIYDSLLNHTLTGDDVSKSFDCRIVDDESITNMMSDFGITKDALKGREIPAKFQEIVNAETREIASEAEVG